MSLHKLLTCSFFLFTICGTSALLFGLFSSLPLPTSTVFAIRGQHQIANLAWDVLGECKQLSTQPSSASVVPKSTPSQVLPTNTPVVSITHEIPTIEFCAPNYNGKLEGPFGTHIVIIGQNFASTLTGLYLTKNKNDIKNCAFTNATDCFTLHLPVASNFNHFAFVLSFSWDFSVNTDAGPVVFYLDATYLNASKELQVVSSTSSFTLLSSAPPCITIITGNTISGASTICRQSQPLSLIGGSPITIEGINWLPGGSQQVIHVSAVCNQSSPCNSSSLFQISLSPNDSGSFQDRLTLPKSAIGKYRIIASNQVLHNSTAGAFLSIDNNTLTFGYADLGDLTALSLTLLPKQSPTSPASLGSFIDMPSLIAMIPALLSFFLFFVVLLRRRISGKSTASGRHDSMTNQLTGKVTSGILNANRAMIRNDLTTKSSNYFSATIDMENVEQERIKAVRLALDNSNPMPAIELAIIAQTSNYLLWRPLLDAVASVSPKSVLYNAANLADSALDQVINPIKPLDKNEVLKLCCTALIHYKWYLIQFPSETLDTANTRCNMAIAYRYLSDADPQVKMANLVDAEACYQVSMHVFLKHNVTNRCAATWLNLGQIYVEMPIGEANLEAAISCYRNALLFFSRERSTDWAQANYQLGKALHTLAVRHRNIHHLDDARISYEAALSVYEKRSNTYIEWAKTKYRLGLLYSEFPIKDEQERDKYLNHALTCFNNALQLYSNPEFLIERAEVLMRIGDTYFALFNGNLQRNQLMHAINYYEEALKICESKHVFDCVQPLKLRLEQAHLALQSLSKGR